MANIKNLEMAQTLSNNPNISISKGFLGIGAKAVYTPSNSRLCALINYYSAEDGEALLKLINMPTDIVTGAARKMQAPKKLNVSNYRVEACIAEDRQFVAIQVLRYADFRHVPIGQVKFFEGEQAEALATLL